MRSKFKKTMLLLAANIAFISTASIAIASCVNNESNKDKTSTHTQNKEITFISAINSSSTNIQDNANNNFLSNNFLNKLKNNNSTNLSINNFSNNEEGFNYPLSPIYKKMRGETFLISSLPKDIEVLNANNESNWFNVEWEQTEDFKLTRDTVIKGLINNGTKNIQVNAYIFVQTKGFKLFTDYKNRDQGMSIDLDKTTKDGGLNNIPKLIDRSGDYVSSHSRWDNWGAYDRPQDTNIVFNWDHETNISRIGINFWKVASKGASAGRLPKNIFIQYSNDGETWFNVSNQDKTSSDDLGPMNTHSARLNNISETKIINFDNVKTRWIRFNWEPAKDNQNRNLIIGITNMQFFGKDDIEDQLIINKNTDIIKLKYGKKEFDLNKKNNNEYVFEVENLEDKIKYMTHSSAIEEYLVLSNDTQKIYKVISYNDKGQKDIYKITFIKTTGVVNEN